MKNATTIVKKILDDLEITKARIPVEDIAAYFKLKIHYNPFEGDISGCLLRDREGNGIIGINSSHHENRQRFTIAHEIGHYLLHKGEPTFIDRKFERINFRSGSGAPVVDTDKIEEIEANKFAAELLMPQDFLIKDILSSNDIEDGNLIDELSEKYGVSSQSLAIRLTNLNLT